MSIWKFMFNFAVCIAIYFIDVKIINATEIYSAMTVLFLYIWFTASDVVNELKNKY